jgi:3-keto-5-aminohexanoate cleavage enzyme
VSIATPVIIEAAINGTTPRERNPHVPRTPEEIAAEAIRCIQAGATIIHNHNDDPVLDMVTAAHAATPYIDAWGPVLASHPDVFLYPTMTGGGAHTTVEQRYGHLPKIAAAGVLRMGIVDPGSVNLGGYEADGAPSASETVYLNSNADIRYMVDTCTDLGVPISFSIFDGSFMRTATAYVRSGRIRNGGQIKIFFGSDFAPFGIPATPAGLEAYLDILGDCPLPWSVALPGGDILDSQVGRLALERGGHLRVGLEDYAGPGQPTNVEILENTAKLCDEVGRPIATPAQTAELMKLAN